MINFTKVDGKDIGDIKIFALSTCMWCKKTKQFLKDHGVAYSYVDVDLTPDEALDEVTEKQMEYNSSGSFPTVVINGKDVIVGYDEQKLEELVA